MGSVAGGEEGSAEDALGAETEPGIQDGRSLNIVEALPAAIYTTDAAGLITFYNEAAAELWQDFLRLLATMSARMLVPPMSTATMPSCASIIRGEKVQLADQASVIRIVADRPEIDHDIFGLEEQ